jgi:hypothetical protein
MIRSNSYLILLLLASVLISGQAKTGSLTIRLHPVFNDKDLVLSENTYVNANGDSLSVDVFKFYFSHLCLEGSNIFCEPESYHLIDVENISTLNFTLKKVPFGTYTTLSFAIGVDSLTNTLGVLKDDLDPINGMYWAWNTGYIAAKIEGRSNSCKTLHHSFEYHIGGYLPPFQSFRTNKIQINNLVIQQEQNYLDLYADLSEWFKTPTLINVSKTNSIVLPNKESSVMADNYIDMIRLKK